VRDATERQMHKLGLAACLRNFLLQKRWPSHAHAQPTSVSLILLRRWRATDREDKVLEGILMETVRGIA